MKRIIGVIFLMLNINIYATEQAMDILNYNDSVSYIFSSDLISDLHPIRGYPLEYFLYRPDIDSIQKEINEDMFKTYRWCLRGYIAKWEIRNDSLFLMEIFYRPTVTAYVESEPSNPFPLQRLFPSRNVTNGVYADWFTGIIKTVDYQSTYPPFDSDKWKDKRKLFYIKNGRIIGLKRT